MPASLVGLSSSYFAFRGKGIYDSVKAVFDLGFDTVELGAAHKFESSAFETVKRIKRDFPNKNYTVHGLFPPLEKPFWFNPSFGLSKQNRVVVDGLFRAAELVEASVVGIHPGFLNELGWGYDKARGFNVLVPGKSLPREKCWAGFSEIVDYALKLSEDVGVTFAVENIHGSEAVPLTFTPADFEKTFSLFPDLKLLFDFGHALFEGKAEDFVKRFGDKIAEVHMHWSEQKNETHERDDHSTISAQEQLELFREVKQFSEIPIIFEHGLTVGEEKVKQEKKLVEAFLKNL